jgi:hypothetical protein
MGTIAALRRRVEELNMEKVAVASITATQDSIADLNAEQMIKGLRSDGSDITPSYTEYTKELKRLKGQPTDRVTLRDIGRFQAAMFTKLQGLEVITGSADLKSAKLEKKYSKSKGSIFGLSERFRAEYIRENLRPAFQKQITDLTGLKF